MKGADTYLTHALFTAIYISYLSEIVPEIAFGKCHDPGQITLSDSESRRQYYC